MSASGTQSAPLVLLEHLRETLALAVEHDAGAGQLEALELGVVGQVGGRLVVEIDHLAEIDGRHRHLLVLAKLPVGRLQIGKIDAAKRLVLAGDRLRIVHRGRDQIVEVDVLDVEGLAHVRAAGAQQPRDLLLIARAVELRLHRVRRGRHLTERKRHRKDLDEERFHRGLKGLCRQQVHRKHPVPCLSKDMQGMPGADCLRQSDPDALAFDDVGKKTERHSGAVELLQRCSVISAIFAGGSNERHHLSHRPDRGHLGDPFVFRSALTGGADGRPAPLPTRGRGRSGLHLLGSCDRWRHCRVCPDLRSHHIRGGDRPCHRFALGHLARYVSGACLVVGALASAHRSRELCARRLSRRPAAGDLGHHGCRRGRIP